MPVFLTTTGDQPLTISPAAVERCAEAILALCGQAGSGLSVLLTDDRRIAELNLKYRGKSGPTNVLAFAMREGEQIHPGDALLGDVVISVETAAREAAEAGSTLHQRLRILLVHGILHLLGHDHERSETEARAMAKLEAGLLLSLDEVQRRTSMIHLAVNVDHVATLRQARGISEPDPLQAAAICENAGAHGIVVHLREDRRHIQERDVRLLRQTVRTRLNLEMAAAEEIIRIALEIRPDMITLVPEKRQELTTEGGLNIVRQRKKLQEVIARMTKADIPVSLFIDPDRNQITAAREIGATFVEIHTGRYCDAVDEQSRDREFDLVARAAEQAREAGLRVNAGHGLNYWTTKRVARLGTIEELSIGHAIMARAILVGLDRAVRDMVRLVEQD